MLQSNPNSDISSLYISHECTEVSPCVHKCIVFYTNNTSYEIELTGEAIRGYLTTILKQLTELLNIETLLSYELTYLKIAENSNKANFRVPEAMNRFAIEFEEQLAPYI